MKSFLTIFLGILLGLLLPYYAIAQNNPCDGVNLTVAFRLDTNTVTMTDDYVLLAPINYTIGAAFYRWDFDDPFSLDKNYSSEENPEHIYMQGGTYRITLSAGVDECRDSVSHTFVIQDPYLLYIPNAFTPNNNGVNEIFLPKGRGVDFQNYQMKIYNRYGHLVFETNHFLSGWNGKDLSGKLCPLGVYTVIIHLKTITGENQEYIRTLTLLR
jgi:gliding motility-associated-like protein